jgi:putative tricarboxylic transport membrane protein
VHRGLAQPAVLFGTSTLPNVADIARLTRTLPYALVGAGAGYLYYVATQFDYQRREGVLGPDFWPKLILALVIATCVYEIVKRLVSRKRPEEIAGVLEDLVEESVKEHGDAGAAAPEEHHPWLLAAGMALAALYVYSLTALGFVSATVPYVAAFIALGGYRRWGVIAAVSVIGTLAMMFFFMKVVYVSLPIGQEPFAQVTLLLMKLMGIR